MMKTKRIAEGDAVTYAIIFERGDEVIEGIESFAEETGVHSAHFTAIGAFQEATLGYFEIERKEYDRIPVEEQVEVLTLAGDIALKDGKPKVHCHVVLGKRDGLALGGHLIEATVRPTLEVILTESPGQLRRRHDETTGLALIDIDT
jgi:predicted DNA-binding protein with PD1-like motif